MGKNPYCNLRDVIVTSRAIVLKTTGIHYNDVNITKPSYIKFLAYLRTTKGPICRWCKRTAISMKLNYRHIPQNLCYTRLLVSH